MVDQAEADGGIWLPEDIAQAAPPAMPFEPANTGIQNKVSRIRLWSRMPSGQMALQQAKNAWRASLAHLLTIIYPPSCLACRAAIAETDALCPQCWSQMRLIERPYCERLGTPFPADLGQGLVSPAAFADPPVYQRSRAVACFGEGPVRDLVHRLKYGDRVELARPMGLWMARAGAELLAGADIIVPVPLHPRRLFSRRFNQAGLLAASIARTSGIRNDPHILKRVKATPPQVGMSRNQRADNAQGAFRVEAAQKVSISGKNVLLVDDVLTSGATANAAARILLRAGAARVDVLVFARVVQDL